MADLRNHLDLIIGLQEGKWEDSKGKISVFSSRSKLNLNRDWGWWATSLVSLQCFRQIWGVKNLHKRSQRCLKITCQGSSFFQLGSGQHSTIVSVQPLWLLKLVLTFTFFWIPAAWDEVPLGFQKLWFPTKFLILSYLPSNFYYLRNQSNLITISNSSVFISVISLVLFKCLNHHGTGLPLHQVNPAHHQWISQQLDCHLCQGNIPY